MLGHILVNTIKIYLFTCLFTAASAERLTVYCLRLFYNVLPVCLPAWIARPRAAKRLKRGVIKSDPDRKNFGFIPLMASCSSGEIGALNAESFAERVISGSNLVMTNGNTLLGDKMLDMLVVLRMNREFMEFMRREYAEEITEDAAV